MREHDTSRYSALLSSLEISELTLARIRTSNSKLRIDSGYFAKPMLAAEDLVRAYSSGYDELGVLFSRFCKGIFDINASAYTATGVPFLRIQNLRNGIIDDEGLVFIPEGIHELESKTELVKGDIVLSKTAYPAAALVTLDRCNTSQDTIATTISTYGRSLHSAESIVAYLNSEIGRRLSQRQFQGNVQLHLSLDDGRKIPVPRLGAALQARISSAFASALQARGAGRKALSSAESLLLAELGLSSWEPPIVRKNVRSYGSVRSAGRLDAEHFEEQYAQLSAKLASYPGGAVEIGDLAGSLTNGAEIREYETEGVPYLRVGDIHNFTVSPDSLVYVDPGAAAKELPKVRLQAGDVLLSRSGSLAVAGVVEPEWEHSLLSSHLIRIRIRDAGIDPYFLAFFLGALPGRMQIQQWSNGGVQPEISQPSLRRVIVPRLRALAQTSLKQLVSDLRANAERARELTLAASNAVDLALSESEHAGVAHLDSVLNPSAAHRQALLAA